MSFLDIFLLVIRWLHGIAATGWVGGGLFYLLILRPVHQRMKHDSRAGLMQSVNAEFRNIVDIFIITLLVTGIILGVSRLTTQTLGIPYYMTLAFKVFLALWRFWLVRRMRHRHQKPEEVDAPQRGSLTRLLLAPLQGNNATVTLGMVIFLLADILRLLVEKNLGG